MFFTLSEFAIFQVFFDTTQKYAKIESIALVNEDLV